MPDLIPPHGGLTEPVNCMVSAADEAALLAEAAKLVQVPVSDADLSSVYRFGDGGLSPLTGPMNEAAYHRVLEEGVIEHEGRKYAWTIPIAFPVTRELAGRIRRGDTVALVNGDTAVATLAVGDVFAWDKQRYLRSVYQTERTDHPGADMVLKGDADKTHLLGGTLRVRPQPKHPKFGAYVRSPREVRALLRDKGWQRVVAFQTRNPLHRAHQELTFRAAKEVEANLLIQPVVGMTKPGDVDHYTRVRCYEHLIKAYPEQTTALSLLPLAMRMGGPREALWHAIIRKNYGCTHFIVGRDHAGPGKDSTGKPFYGPYDAQNLLKEHEKELGITMVPFKNMVYVEDKAQYFPDNEVEPGMRTLDISGTELRRRLQEGADIPEWFSFPEVVAELRRTHPPRHRQGFTVFFTGLSGSGKSTVANALMVKLMEMGGRPVTLLDGDVVRKHLSSELGFSKEHRDLNIQRIGYVASEITKNGGIAICAPIAPYAATRKLVREMIEPLGGFVELHVATPIEVCEARDRKGLYAKARAGILKGFTGIDDPYEVPEKPELRLDTAELTPDLAAHRIIVKLESLGFIR